MRAVSIDIRRAFGIGCEGVYLRIGLPVIVGSDSSVDDSDANAASIYPHIPYTTDSQRIEEKLSVGMVVVRGCVPRFFD